jgi:hypothetical protein
MLQLLVVDVNVTMNGTNTLLVCAGVNLLGRNINTKKKKHRQ